MIISVRMLNYPGDFVRQSSADVHFLEKVPIDIEPLCDFGSRKPQFIAMRKQTMTDRHVITRGMVGNLCNLQSYCNGIRPCVASWEGISVDTDANVDVQIVEKYKGKIIARHQRLVAS